jgi:hypothetical protein
MHRIQQSRNDIVLSINASGALTPERKMPSQRTHHRFNRVDVRMRLLAILIVLCVFPYFSPIRLGIDTSPLYLLPALAVFAIGVGGRNVTLRYGLWLVVCGWISLGVLTAAKALLTSNVGAMRFSVGLCSQGLLIAALGATPLKDSNYSIRTITLASNTVYWGSFAWLAASVAQFLSALAGSPTGAQITSLFVSASRTTQGRGLTSLAAEPSFAGITCCLLAAFAWILKSNGLIDPRRGSITIASFVIVTVLTASFTSFLSLGLLGLFIARRSTLAVAAMLTFIVLLLLLPIEAVQELRIAQLVKMLTSSPDLLLVDTSTAMRAADVSGRLLSLGLPGGMFGHFFERDPMPVLQQALGLIGGETRGHLQYAADTMLRNSQPMSSVGDLAFNFGIFGLALYFATIILIWRCMRASNLRGGSALVILATFGFMIQLPLSYPTALALPLLLGLAGKPAEKLESASTTAIRSAPLVGSIESG